MEQQSNFTQARVRGSEKADKGDAAALDSRSSEMELEVHREQRAHCWSFLNISATFVLSSEGGVKTGDLSRFNACVCVSLSLIRSMTCRPNSHVDDVT